MRNERENVYIIPPNYTDSGKILGGLVSARNALEALLLAIIVGYIEINNLSLELNEGIVVFVLTVIPIGALGLIGLEGDSLIQYLCRIVLFVKRRRKIIFRRIGRYAKRKKPTEVL